jgi:hypothetical protein
MFWVSVGSCTQSNNPALIILVEAKSFCFSFITAVKMIDVSDLAFYPHEENGFNKLHPVETRRGV